MATEELRAAEAVPRTPSVLGHVVGIVLIVGALGMLAAAIVDLIDRGPDADMLAISGLVTLVVGATLWRLTKIPKRIRLVDVFIVVTGSWVALSIAATIPYLLTDTFDAFDQALFESVAGLTTTGATVLRPIEGNSQGILFWRSLTQWFGGIGVIVVVVAALPALRGGMSMLEAEAPGPSGDQLAPRIRDTAQRLVGIYLLLSFVMIALYAIAGMNLYDAVSHSLTTVSTGGFSPHNASIAHFESAAIEWVAILGMFLAGGSFALYFWVLRGNPRPLLRSTEFRVYLGIVAAATVFVLVAQADVEGIDLDAIRGSLFTTISVISTTGYVAVDFGSWADSAQVLLLLLMPIGAMAGSTAGGVKLVRVLVVGSVAGREARRQLHPTLVRPVRVGKDPVADGTASRVIGFLVFALAIFGTGAMVVAMTGADLLTSFSASATSFGNVGPGLGAIGPTSDMLALDEGARWMAMAEMLLGRLEIYPVVLAFAVIRVPRFVRRLS